MNLRRVSVFLCLLSVFAVSGQAQQSETWRSWNQPVEPFRIVGNLYYVGASDIAAYLITTPDGHIVIDGGFPETAPLIRQSILDLGFALEDVRILLNSHAHFDHSGGLAELKKWTGAELWASEADAPVIASGGAGDYLLSAEDNAFPAVAVDKRLKDRDTVSLGGTTLTAHVTAGHTRGCTTWSMKIREGEEIYDVVSVCSVSVLPDVELVGNTIWPEVAEAYQQSFERLKSLPCDVFLAPHASFYGLKGKREKVAAGTQENPFVDPEGYRAYLARGERHFNKVWEEQKAAAEKRK